MGEDIAAKTTEILNNITTLGEKMGGGLETIRLLDPKIIASFIINEHPQTAAIILAHLEPAAASLTVLELPEENRMDILHRLATLEHVAPSVIRDLDEVLQAEFRASDVAMDNKLGGVEIAAEVLSFLDRTTEINILSTMNEVDPDLVNEIRDLRFTFEDILKINDNGIQAIMKEINQEDLLIGLKAATDELKDKIFANMSERVALMMKKDLESLEPTKISEVEKAQQKAIAVCKKLEGDGKLTIGDGADTPV